MYQPTHDDNIILNRIRARARELNIPFISIELSPRSHARTGANKKIRIVYPVSDYGTAPLAKQAIKTVDFGSDKSVTYIEGASSKKRSAYRARASKIIKKDGSRAIDTYMSPAYLSYYLLW